MDVIRVGTLGAARITPPALIRPARANAEVEVVAVAARDRARAEKFAAKHGIPRVGEDYAAIVADPEIDAIYNPLPNSLHAVWTERALAAGKHVLCEKPFASNATEAARVASAAAATDLVVMARGGADARDRALRRAGPAPARGDRDVHPAPATE
jgi:predicted dehydrogenase